MSGAGQKRRFGVGQFTASPWSLEDALERLPKLRVDAIELTEDKLDRDRCARQIAAVRAAGLAISGLQPQVRTFFASRMVPKPPTVAARARAALDAVAMPGDRTRTELHRDQWKEDR